MDSLTYLRILFSNRSNPLHVHYLTGKRVLDVGCGEGDFLAKDKTRRVGIDIDNALVHHCRERGFEAHCMSATEIRLPAESFDAVHAAELIEHLEPEAAARFLSEAARVLKSGGLVYLTTPGEGVVWNTFSHVRPYPPIAFRKLLNNASEGFVRKDPIPLRLERSFAFSAPRGGLVVTGLRRSFEVGVPCRHPQGYVIVLRKP